MATIQVPGLKDSDGVVFKCIPAGKYPVRINEVVVKPAKATAKYPDSQVLSVRGKVLEGDHADSNQFTHILLPSESMDETMQQRCVAKLKRLCNACGLAADDDFDTADLFGAECTFIVSVRTKPGSSDEQNSVDDFIPTV